MPASSEQATQFGLDLGSETSAETDGTVDNQLGAAFAAFTTLGFDIQGANDAAVDQGSIILLFDLQTKDFNNASASGFGVEFGANPMPTACTDATDAFCRHHLDGTASFQIAPDSPTDAPVVGTIVSGTFNGGPGVLTLQIAIGGTTPIDLHLLHARVQASGISDTGIMTAKVGGLVTQEEFTPQVGPTIQVQVAGILARDCTAGASPPGCGCTGTGATVIMFDANHDCMLSPEEILTNPVVQGLLQPDSCSRDSCTTTDGKPAPDSLSIGVQVQAVKATFPM